MNDGKREKLRRVQTTQAWRGSVGPHASRGADFPKCKVSLWWGAGFWPTTCRRARQWHPNMEPFCFSGESANRAIAFNLRFNLVLLNYKLSRCETGFMWIPSLWGCSHHCKGWIKNNNTLSNNRGSVNVEWWHISLAFSMNFTEADRQQKACCYCLMKSGGMFCSIIF